MVTAGDFRNGVTFEMDGNVYSIIEFQHVKPGKGAAFVRTKIRNVISGAVTEKTFNPNDKYPTAFIERKDMEYLYNDGDLYYFMDSETYEQLPISPNVLGELEEEFYDIDEDEDDDDVDAWEDDEDECYYEVTCPKCGDTIELNEEMLDEGSIDCPNCGETLEFDLEEDDSCDCGENCDCNKE